jgi:uncharacterized protein
MTLTDAGALVALLDTDDPYHPACVAAAQRLPAGPLLTTWVCFTEAMYLLGTVGGYRYQAALWNLRATGRIVLHELTPAEADRMAALMAQYQDTPMDLAGASLVVVAESRTLRRVFTGRLGVGSGAVTTQECSSTRRTELGTRADAQKRPLRSRC